MNSSKINGRLKTRMFINLKANKLIYIHAIVYIGFKKIVS